MPPPREPPPEATPANKHAWQTSLSSEAPIVHVRHPFDAGTLEILTRRLAKGRDSCRTPSDDGQLARGGQGASRLRPGVRPGPRRRGRGGDGKTPPCRLH